jgi:hypothetical protein
MAELRLGKKEQTKYGSRFSGVVETDDREISITWREPLKSDKADAIYILPTGWTGAKNSMRVAAHEAVRADHIAVT